MPRILHILDHSIPLHSGYTFRTLSLLREQRALGWETFHVTGMKQGASDALEQEVDGWHFFRTPDHGAGQSSLVGLNEIRLMNATARRLEQIVEQVKPDLLHAHSPALNALPALRVARNKNIPVVYEVRAFWEDAAVDHGTSREGGLRYRLTRAMETYALKRVDHVFTICEGLRHDIVARGLPAAKVTVIANAVDPKDFSAAPYAPGDLRHKLGLSDAVVLGFIGSFYAYEGLDLLLTALPRIIERLPNVKVLLVGGGPEENNLKQQARDLGLAERVIFVGRVPHDQVGGYYDLVDVLVYPRHRMRLTELVTPLKPLEAMAQQRIFVASDVGGHKELIRDNETGFLFPAEDAVALADRVIDVLNRRGDWPRINRQAFEFVQNERTWRNSVANYRAVYARLTAR